MSTSRTYTANRSSLFASAGTPLGGGADKHIPSGYWGGYRMRGVVDFPAIDWSDATALVSATLTVRVTSQVHLGFGSDRRMVVARATSSWTPNSASSGADGGGGWSTSPTVYPGPNSTSPLALTMPSSGTKSIDVLAQVKAWAPTAIGGSAAAQHGLVIYPESSSSADNVEVYSAKESNSSYRPTLTLVYETDRPPVAPSVTVPADITTNRPTLTGTASDPDEDPVEVYDVEVSQGSTVHYSRTNQTAGISGMDITHAVAANLPTLVPLAWRMRTRHAGVWSPWSSKTATWTLNRNPNAPTFDAPPATVADNLRPTFTIRATDPDGEAIAYWSLEVYEDDGTGQPTGSPIYFRNDNAWTGGATHSHTPNADLLVGDMLYRSRVATGPTPLTDPWKRSVWSGYSKLRITAGKPGITYREPGADYNYLRVPTLADASTNIDTGQKLHIAWALTLPPTGTITSCTVKLEVPSTGPVLFDGPVTLLGGGGAGEYAMDVAVPTTTAVVGKVLNLTISAVASVGGVVNTRVRPCRVSYGRASMNGIASGASPKNWKSTWTRQAGSSDDVYVHYRAQTSVGGGALGPGYVETIEEAGSYLPAAGGFMGIMIRVGRRDMDDAVVGGVDRMEITWESLG